MVRQLTGMPAGRQLRPGGQVAATGCYRPSISAARRPSQAALWRQRLAVVVAIVPMSPPAWRQTPAIPCALKCPLQDVVPSTRGRLTIKL